MKTKVIEKLNNKGFSLVEVIVSIAIIAVLAAPIIYSFMSAEKVNQKSKTVQEATLIAQNTLESFKASNTPTMINSLLDASSGSSDMGIIGEIISNCQVKQYDSLGNEVTQIETDPLGIKYVCKIRTNKSGKPFDIEVTLSSSEYSNTGNVNSYEEPIIKDIDKSKKAYISDEVLIYDSLIAGKFIDMATFTDVDVLKFRNDTNEIVYTNGGVVYSLTIHKKMIIKVEKVSGEFYISTMVKYTVNNFPYIKVDNSVGFEDKVITYEVYRNKYSFLPEIYLFYSAWNGSSDKVDVEVASDTLNSGELINVYMIKQKNIDADIFNPATNVSCNPSQVNFRYIRQDEDYDEIVKKNSSKIRLYKINVKVSNSNISPVVIESTKEE